MEAAEELGKDESVCEQLQSTLTENQSLLFNLISIVSHLKT